MPWKSLIAGACCRTCGGGEDLSPAPQLPAQRAEEGTVIEVPEPPRCCYRLGAAQHPDRRTHPPDIAAARRRGPADVVEAHWQSLRLSWRWRHAVHQIRSPGRPYPGIVALLEAAAAQPRLRRLCPFTSHFALLFSSSTSYPWTVQAGSIEPLETGRFKVRRRSPVAVIGKSRPPKRLWLWCLNSCPPVPSPSSPTPRASACDGVWPRPCDGVWPRPCDGVWPRPSVSAPRGLYWRSFTVERPELWNSPQRSSRSPRPALVPHPARWPMAVKL
ncbi:DUF6193 family natural product biosynthesis protein [Streptomyces sp. NPDC048506]|uniref:DUF6193 family natural product biosynthesis protein n=1 Tax=Streptomyces sp. NPDC048506 TaxID=3155028 RepID=UPI0034135E8C